MKNLQKLGASPFPYIVPVLRRLLSREVVEGEHFILVDLLKSLPGISSQAGAALEPLVRPDHLPLAVQDPKLVPQAVKRKKEKKTGQGKVADMGLEGLMDWKSPGVNESAGGGG